MATGTVSHAGLGLVRRLADKTGLTPDDPEAALCCAKPCTGLDMLVYPGRSC